MGKVTSGISFDKNGLFSIDRTKLPEKTKDFYKDDLFIYFLDKYNNGLGYYRVKEEEAKSMNKAEVRN